MIAVGIVHEQRGPHQIRRSRAGAVVAVAKTAGRDEARMLAALAPRPDRVQRRKAVETLRLITISTSGIDDASKPLYFVAKLA